MASISKNLEVMTQVRRINKELNGVVETSSGAVGDTLFTQAALLASEIKSVTPVDETSDTPGQLRETVRVEPGSATSKKAIVVKVKAGGARTTDKTGFDHARGVEFGTQNASPHPFFFPVYRARRKAIRSVVKKAIKNAVRGTFK